MAENDHVTLTIPRDPPATLTIPRVHITVPVLLNSLGLYKSIVLLRQAFGKIDEDLALQFIGLATLIISQIPIVIYLFNIQNGWAPFVAVLLGLAFIFILAYEVIKYNNNKWITKKIKVLEEELRVCFDGLCPPPVASLASLDPPPQAP